MIKNSILILFIINFQFLNGQKISGKIIGIDSNEIKVCYIRTYLDSGLTKLYQYKQIVNGNYSFVFEPTLEKLFFQILSPSYITLVKKVELVNTNIIQDFYLYRKIQKEETVEIRAQPQAVTIKNDTTFYNIEKFKDGTERKLQDLLIKLPGIDVNIKTGQINFKGKAINTILLEGDDLMGSDYASLSKNLDVSVLKDIQAIENFSDNYVLKGLGRTEDVVLNINLKKTKFNISGSSDLGIGIFGINKIAHNYSNNIVGVGNIHKFFNIASYNNIGINYSNIDLQSPNNNSSANRKYKNSKLLYEPNINSPLEANRTNINNQFFFNQNSLIKITNNSRLKINAFSTTDKLNLKLDSKTKLFNELDTINIYDNNALIKVPKYFTINTYYRNNLSKTKLLEISNTIEESLNKTKQNGNNNYTGNTHVLFKSDEIFIKSNLTISTRLNEKKAIQIIATNVFTNTNQQFIISPAFIRKTNSLFNEQNSYAKNRFFEIEAVLHGKVIKGDYKLFLNVSTKKIDYSSSLILDSNTNNLVISANLNNYNLNKIQQKVNYNFNLNKWRLTFNNNVNFLTQNITDKNKQFIARKINLIVEPTLSINKKISSNKTLLIRTSFDQKPLVENYLYSSYLLQANRTISNNILGLELQKNFSISINYFYINLYNQFECLFGTSLDKNFGVVISKLGLSDTLLVSTSEFQNLFEKNGNAFFTTKKYFPILKTNLRLSSIFSKGIYNNYINSNTLRENTSNNFRLEFFGKTIFKSKFNFENTLTLKSNKIYQNNNKANSLILKSITNVFSILIKPNNFIFANVSYDINLPNYNVKINKASFLDFSLTFRPKYKKIEMRLGCKNILNRKSLNFIENSDYYFKQININLLERSMVMNITFKL